MPPLAKPLHLAEFRPRVAGFAVDGATAFSCELRTLARDARLGTRRHRFEDLVPSADEPRASSPSRPAAYGLGGGTALASIGPYAWLYHRLREMGRFRGPIVRDVHAGAWSGYLMQEWLCESLTRPGDVVLFPSRYAARLYAELFPRSARSARFVVRHPRFDGRGFDSWSPGRLGDRLRVGAIGRLSRDKNLPDIVDAAAELARTHRRRRVELHVLGGPCDLTPADLARRWSERGGDPAAFRYWGWGLPAERVTSFYRSIDVLAFLSTSNVEALGRVVVEARQASVPVCMADHAAAGELVGPHARVPVHRRPGPWRCDDGIATGSVDPARTASILERVALDRGQEPIVDEAPYFREPFVAACLRGFGDDARIVPGASRDFLRVELPARPSATDALRIADGLVDFLRAWSSEGPPDRSSRRTELDRVLLAETSDEARSRDFLSLLDAGRIDYGDLAGYPFQLAQIAGFRATARYVDAASGVLPSHRSA